MHNRKILLIIIFVTFFSIISLIWYFFFTVPKSAPSLSDSGNSLIQKLLPQSGFIFGVGKESISTSTTEIIPQNKQALIKVWDKPSIGNSFFNREYFTEIEEEQTKNGTTTLVRKTVRATSTVLMFVDRTTGYVYGHSIESGNTYQISNTTLPGIKEAYIFDNGNRIILRYLDSDNTTVVNIIANIPKVTEGRDASSLENIAFLPSNTTSVAVSGDGKKISYVVTNPNGSSIYTINQDKGSLIANSLFSEWSIMYGGNNLYGVSKPSAYIEGTAFEIPSFRYVDGGRTGLNVSVSTDSTYLASVWTQSGLQTYVSDTNSHIIKNLSIKTLSDKCISRVASLFFCSVPQNTFNSVEGLPDDWYQGNTSFSDSIVMITAKSGDIYPVYKFNSSIQYDIESLDVSQNSNLISFINKNDSSLWLLVVDRITSL